MISLPTQGRKKSMRMPHSSRLLTWIRTAVAGFAFAASAATLNAQTAKDTLFGSEPVAANGPNGKAQDLVNALSVSAAIGGHSCFTWHWNDPNFLSADVAALPPLMRQFGLKSVIQVGAAFLGNP